MQLRVHVKRGFQGVGAATIALALSSFPAQALVTDVARYRLGEADPGAVAGAVGDNPTVDSAGALDLTRFDAPTYSADVPPTNVSTLAMHFDGIDDRYSVGSIASPVTDNFGIEAWAKSDGSTSGVAIVAYNGDSSFHGWGVFRSGNSYAALFGGVLVFGSSPVTANWTHLALVRDGGVATFYVNGTSQGTTGAAPNTPNTLPNGGMMIGGNVNGAVTEWFDGRIDEVRVFTFQAGQFSVADLTLGHPGVSVPAQTEVGLAGVVLFLFLYGALALRVRASV